METLKVDPGVNGFWDYGAFGADNPGIDNPWVNSPNKMAPFDQEVSDRDKQESVVMRGARNTPSKTKRASGGGVPRIFSTRFDPAFVTLCEREGV